MHTVHLVPFKDSDSSVPTDSTGFNKVGITTASGHLIFEHRGQIVRRPISYIAGLPQDQIMIAPQFNLERVQAYFCQRGLTPPLFHRGLKWLITHDAHKFLQPPRIEKHDQVDLATLSRRYQELRDAAIPGDMLLTFLPSSCFSRLICLVDRGPWSHAALITDCMTVVEAVTSGVREISIDHYTTPPFRLGLFRLDPPALHPTRAIEAARTQIGARYSYAKALLVGAQKAMRIPRSVPTPNDLALSHTLLPICRA